MNVKYPSKIIELEFPLDDINVAAAREKFIRPHCICGGRAGLWWWPAQ